jgi:hypothetical protein
MKVDALQTPALLIDTSADLQARALITVAVDSDGTDHGSPTIAMHDQICHVDGDDVVDRWSIDLRGW